jgi:protease-4
VLEIKFDEDIVERGKDNPMDFDFGSFKPSHSLGLDEIMKYLDKASGDEKVKGIFLNLSGVSAGIATWKNQAFPAGV